MNKTEITENFLQSYRKKLPSPDVNELVELIYQCVFNGDDSAFSAENNDHYVLAVEGRSASGKSTLAEMLLAKCDCTVFHMDDFFLRPEQRTPERYAEPGGNLDRERFLSQILSPLSEKGEVVYNKFNCEKMTLGEMIKAELKPLIIIEGSYSVHPDFEKYYDLSIFLDISPELQRDRIKKRNPDRAKSFFEKWIPLEENYFLKTDAKNRCDLCIAVK